MEEDIKILKEFVNNYLQRDKLEIDCRCGGYKIGKIYKITELNPAIEHLVQAYKQLEADNYEQNNIISEQIDIIKNSVSKDKIIENLEKYNKRIQEIKEKAREGTLKTNKYDYMLIGKRDGIKELLEGDE